MEKFRAFVPIDIIEKGKKDENGLPEKLVIAGVASSMKSGKRDKDGHILNVNGFDYQPFLKSGFFNLEHKGREDYANIVGEPTKAYVKDGEFHVEGILYKDNPKAVGIYQLGQVLKKSGSTRKIGYSIEGHIAQRNPLDPNDIAKSVITGCAITISPKNDGTELLFKADGADFEYETQQGTELLVDVIENGYRYTVDKDLNITKAMVAGEMTGTDTTDKSMTQEPLKKESLLGATKKKKKKDKKTFSKSETYVEILSRFTYDDIESVKRFYNLVEQIQKSLTPDMELITKEAIEKAQQILGLAKAESTTTPAASPTPTAEELKKAEDEALQKELADALAKAEDIKAKIAGTAVAKKDESTPKTEELAKSEVMTLVKGFEEKVGALGTLVSAKMQENEELKKSLQQVIEFNQQLGEKIGLIAKQPLDRKSVTTQQFIEKGGEGQTQLEKGVRTISLANKTQRAQLSDLLYKASLSADGKSITDKEFAKAVPCVELGSLGSTPDEARSLSARLLNEHKIVVTK